MTPQAAYTDPMQPTITIKITETWTITWLDGQETTWQTAQEIVWPADPEAAERLPALAEDQVGDAPDKNMLDDDDVAATDG